MKVTGEQIKSIAKEHQITSWPIHECSMCGYECGYKFREHETDYQAGYDSGCYCVSYPTGIEIRAWDEVADMINCQSKENVIKEFAEFWRLELTPIGEEIFNGK